VQQIESCRRQLHRPNKLTLARPSCEARCSRRWFRQSGILAPWSTVPLGVPGALVCSTATGGSLAGVLSGSTLAMTILDCLPIRDPPPAGWRMTTLGVSRLDATRLVSRGSHLCEAIERPMRKLARCLAFQNPPLPCGRGKYLIS
jgi:hypothetical protein